MTLDDILRFAFIGFFVLVAAVMAVWLAIKKKK